MKKIVFLVGGMGRGGAERVISILSNYYVEKGWKVDICMLLHNTVEYELNEEINVIDMSYENMRFPINRIKMLLKLRKYIKKEAGNIIVPFLAKMNVIFMFATLGLDLTNKRIVTSERIDPYCSGYSPVLRFFVNKSFEKADCIVFQTERAQGFYSENIKSKSVIIGNPVALKVLRKKSDKHIIITAGRLVPQKNQKMLIKAFSNIASKYSDYVLHIYGKGKLYDEFKKLITDLRMEDRIFLKGVSSIYQEKLSEAEIFVLPSNFEGLSNALLEALLMGIPSISTDCAGADEVIDNYQNGIIIPVGNEVELEKQLEKLIRDKQLQKKLSENSKKLSQRYSLEKVINKWTEVFEQVN